MTLDATEGGKLQMMGMTQGRRALLWALLALVVAVLCAAAFRGYLSTDMLLNFANWVYC